jgi:hypothetical protein
MPEKYSSLASEIFHSVDEVHAWDQLAPGTAQMLAPEILQSLKHDRSMAWAKFIVKSLVRIAACAVAVLVATRHGDVWAVIPAGLAVISTYDKALGILQWARNSREP